jgi:hypothetical protein
MGSLSVDVVARLGDGRTFCEHWGTAWVVRLVGDDDVIAETTFCKFPDGGAHRFGVVLEREVLVEAFARVGEVVVVIEEILPGAFLVSVNC